MQNTSRMKIINSIFPFKFLFFIIFFLSLINIYDFIQYTGYARRLNNSFYYIVTLMKIFYLSEYIDFIDIQLY
ncbi:MAG: hypothetical protein JXJ04_07700, partial [Spirochaetales bacterium]|nr:hypothetical protein [Spirochaetales bacterium]